MKVSDPLLSAWARTLDRHQNRPAILDEHRTSVRTFEQIERRADDFAASLHQFGEGSVVAVQIGNHPDWPSVLLGCLRKGLVVVPLDRTVSAQDRDAALKICQASGLVTFDPADPECPNDAAPAVSRIGVQDVSWRDNTPCLLKLTSGTTAAPRAIRFRSQQLIADCDQICNTMGIAEDDLNFGVIPISHSYGFSNLLTPLLVRGVPLVLTSDRVPRAVLRNLARSDATVFAGMPIFYQAFVAMAEPLPLPKLRLCISAGAPLPTQLGSEFSEKYGRSIHSFYGSSECGGICYDREGNCSEQGFVGPPMNGVTIEPVECGSTATQVRIRSEAVGDGYFPDSDEGKLGNGTFTPDDLLARSENGWRTVGRVSDVINVAGKKVNPAEVEAELLSVPGVREAAVFGRTSSLRHQEVAACVVVRSALSENDLLKICRRRLSAWQVPKRIFLLDELPVNERGKLSRRDLAVRFAGE